MIVSETIVYEDNWQFIAAFYEILILTFSLGI